MAFVYDFKDIASRMKGELKREPEPEVEIVPPLPNSWWRNPPVRSFCAPCNGSGVDPMHGGMCRQCIGTGVNP